MTSLDRSSAGRLGGQAAPSSTGSTVAVGTGTVRELLTITVIVSACSLLYELSIAQTLSLLAGNTVVWYSLTVGAYLGAMLPRNRFLSRRSGSVASWARVTGC